MLYIIVFLILCLIMMSYIFTSKRLHESTKLYHVTSGVNVNLPEGGVIFLFAAILYVILHYLIKDVPLAYLIYFFVGICIVALNAYLYEKKGTPFIFYIALQALSLTLIFWGLYLFLFLSVWQIIISYLLCLLCMNMFDSMETSNWMCALYSLSVFLPLVYLKLFLLKDQSEIDFLIIPALACVVVLLFSMGKNPSFKFGRIGGAMMGFWILFLLLKLILFTHSALWILLLSVFLTDFIGTFIHALVLKKNPFNRNGLFLYEVLSDGGLKLDKRLIAVLFAVIQIFFSLFVIRFYNTLKPWILLIAVVVPLFILYIFKIGMMREIDRKNKS